MKNLAIFDLDNTLINTDSDHSWPQYLIKKGLVDAQAVPSAQAATVL